MPSISNTDETTVMDLEVGAYGISYPIIHTTSETIQSSNEIEPSSTTICPPELALSAIESALTPLKAGLIPDDLVSVLVVPKTKDVSGRTKRRKGDGKARILSTKEIQEEIDSKENKTKEDEKNKLKRKELREKRKARENY
ncbi:Hypothetical predicted protein [Mytilus galloprovincialis]|uniref:Uncharacterized protein n=1 Tax=Mytilus galloprovincialis TaxID=29158 RepID=A0A8B6GQV0_MYTGA|nr:Hypothetical predicted protein [Mytilus galloprovincialis]